MSMLALRFDLPEKSSNDVLAFAEKFLACGAVVNIESRPGIIVYAILKDGEEQGVLHCLESKLDQGERLMLEHAIANWDQLFNFYLESIGDEGTDKNSKEARIAAETVAYEHLTGAMANPENVVA
jgi:hypothetical protein